MKNELILPAKVAKKSKPVVALNPEALITSKEGTLVLLALLEALSYNVLSGDVWFLSMRSAEISL